MAKKKKTPRHYVGLTCSKCGSQNYLVEYNKNNEILKKQTTDESTFPLNKYCKVCQEHTSHKKRDKLK